MAHKMSNDTPFHRWLEAGNNRLPACLIAAALSVAVAEWLVGPRSSLIDFVSPWTVLALLLLPALRKRRHLVATGRLASSDGRPWAWVYTGVAAAGTAGLGVGVWIEGWGGGWAHIDLLAGAVQFGLLVSLWGVVAALAHRKMTWEPIRSVAAVVFVDGVGVGAASAVIAAGSAVLILAV